LLWLAGVVVLAATGVLGSDAVSDFALIDHKGAFRQLHYFAKDPQTKAIVLFEMNAFAPQMRSIADSIGDCSELVRRSMPLLANVGRHAGQLTEICQQIGRIEGQADDLYDQGLKQLYLRVKGGDTMEFVRSNEIYDHLEKSVDRFDDIANQIQGIVIEHV